MQMHPGVQRVEVHPEGVGAVEMHPRGCRV